jgi:hypothetical protein
MSSSSCSDLLDTLRPGDQLVGWLAANFARLAYPITNEM